MTVIFYRAGVESIQAKWDEMFGVKEEEVKVKKPRKKAKKKALKKTVGGKPVTKRVPAKKEPSEK